MFKTEHNLRVLEKKIRQAVTLIDGLKQSGHTKADNAKPAAYDDLPLLRTVLAPSKPEDVERYLQERAEIKRRVEKILAELERVLG